MIFANTFKRPRCDIPITNSLMPISAPHSITSSSAGIRVSQPSNENRFCPTNLVCKKFSKAVASFSLERMRRFLLIENSAVFWQLSIFCSSQFTISGLRIYLYSAPILAQYVCSRCSMIRFRVAGPIPISVPE